MITKDQHREALRAFEVDRLLKILAIEAKKHHDGHFTVLSFTTGYKAAFGTPDLDTGGGRVQVYKIQSHERLKDALIDALVESKNFEGYFSGPFDFYAYIDGQYD